MPDEVSTSKRDLVARVATLELLVGDHQRDRLYTVLNTRQRMLKQKKSFEPT